MQIFVLNWLLLWCVLSVWKKKIPNTWKNIPNNWKNILEKNLYFSLFINEKLSCPVKQGYLQNLHIFYCHIN